MVKLQALGGVNRHELHGIFADLGLLVARFQRRQTQKSSQRGQGFSSVVGKGQDDLGADRGGGAAAGSVPQRWQIGPQIGGLTDLAQQQPLTGWRLAQGAWDVGAAWCGFVQGQSHCVSAKAFLHDKTFARIDEFFQVFHAVGPIAVGAVVGQQTRLMQHHVDGVAQGVLHTGFAHDIEFADKGANGTARPPGDVGSGIDQSELAGLGGVLQHLNAACADATRRHVQHPQKTGVIAGVFEQTQIGQGVFDFGPIKKAQPAIDPVGNGGVHHGLFQGPALRVAAVEHSDFAAQGGPLCRLALAQTQQLSDFIAHPTGFVVIGGGLADANAFARALAGAQVFAQALAVVGDQVVGGVENVLVAAVVFFQFDLLDVGELAQKVGHVAHPCAAKGVDALIVVAHGQHRCVWPNQLFQPSVLQAVGVLKLVHQDVFEALLVVAAQLRVVAQQLVTAQQQLGKIHHALALALGFVVLKQLDFLACEVVADGHRAGAQALFLAVVEEPSQFFGGVAFFIDVELFAQPFHGRQLVLAVQNLKTCRQSNLCMVQAQQAVAQAVEGTDPQATHRHRHGQKGLQAVQHFLGGFVGEGHSQQLANADVLGVYQPSHARGQHPCFARPGPSQHQGVTLGQGDGLQLLGVESLQQGRIGRCSRCSGRQKSGRHGGCVHEAAKNKTGMDTMDTIAHRAQVSCARFFCACGDPPPRTETRSGQVLIFVFNSILRLILKRKPCF